MPGPPGRSTKRSISNPSPNHTCKVPLPCQVTYPSTLLGIRMGVSWGPLSSSSESPHLKTESHNPPSGAEEGRGMRDTHPPTVGLATSTWQGWHGPR